MHKHFLPSVLLLSLCLGCGTGEYESRIGQHSSGSAAADLLGPAEELPGTRVSFHAPSRMTLLPAGTDPKRTQLPPMQLPGVQQRVYEGFVKDTAGGQTPFYCLIMSMQLPKGPGVNVTEGIKNAMTKTPGGGTRAVRGIPRHEPGRQREHLADGACALQGSVLL